MNLPNQPKILAATYNPISNTKMISFLVDFPTVLLAELRTHRILTQGSLYEHSELTDFNLSANSARAIPHNKYLQKVIDNPFVPIWTKQQSGMSGELLENSEYATDVWINALKDKEEYNNSVIDNYNQLLSLNAHKQNANRLLAPFAWTTCIISGTEWENFFRLRTAPEAQPEFREIALILKGLYDNAKWREGVFHIPYFNEIEELYFDKVHEITEKDDSLGFFDLYMKISASMCAKLSYNTQDNEDTFEKHLDRANMLVAHKHQEPFSHQAVAMNRDEYENMFTQSIVKINGKREIKRTMGVAYNLRGFISQRYMLENW